MHYNPLKQVHYNVLVVHRILVNSIYVKETNLNDNSSGFLGLNLGRHWEGGGQK